MKTAKLWGDFLGCGRVHTKKQCKETARAFGLRNCVIHNPSVHHMRDWPMVLRESTLIERTCPHGVGHPDPDSLDYFIQRDPDTRLGIHGCDGCCTP